MKWRLGERKRGGERERDESNYDKNQKEWSFKRSEKERERRERRMKRHVWRVFDRDVQYSMRFLIVDLFMWSVGLQGHENWIGFYVAAGLSIELH